MIKLNSFLQEANDFLPGNILNFKFALICILLKRSLLIEDVPGMGKTTFVKFLGKSLGLNFNRIQFTPDLLPFDILGVSIFKKETSDFIFKKGPIFSDLVLADELNRGTPKVQSALLEALEEKQVSVDGQTYPLSEFFCLIATQNPREQLGTYPLPESQLDRFLFKTQMGKLSRVDEAQIIISDSRNESLKDVKTIIGKEDLAKWREKALKVKVSDNVLNYVLDLAEKTRSTPGTLGLSPRATKDIVDSSRAFAFLEGREFITTDDVQELFPFIVGHRLYAQKSYSVEREHLLARELLETVEVKLK